MKTEIKAVKFVGKSNLSTPRFRIIGGIENKNPQDIVIAHYDTVTKEEDGAPEVYITNTYNIVDILNECIDDYHERHRNE
tara:strand:- start:1802 stop:2041 length:240 start_codon:yes stop_codon:yes gene_type:complete